MVVAAVVVVAAMVVVAAKEEEEKETVVVVAGMAIPRLLPALDFLARARLGRTNGARGWRGGHGAAWVAG